jgi:hypothetical protein
MGWSMASSIDSSTLSGSLVPCSEKNLMPLSFQHVTGDAGVLADQDGRTGAGCVAFGQHLAGCVAEAHHEVRRDRCDADLTTNTIRTEIFTCHASSLLLSI